MFPPKPPQCKVWNDITLLCNDYKLLAHVYANRLNVGLSQIIDEFQSAFIKGRSIHNHIRLIFDMLDYRNAIDTDSFVLFLDFYKAFDTVEHAFFIGGIALFGLWKRIL